MTVSTGNGMWWDLVQLGKWQRHFWLNTQNLSNVFRSTTTGYRFWEVKLYIEWEGQLKQSKHFQKQRERLRNRIYLTSHMAVFNYRFLSWCWPYCGILEFLCSSRLVEPWVGKNSEFYVHCHLLQTAGPWPWRSTSPSMAAQAQQSCQSFDRVSCDIYGGCENGKYMMSWYFWIVQPSVNLAFGRVVNVTFFIYNIYNSCSMC